jgi:hypothetical protein
MTARLLDEDGLPHDVSASTAGRLVGSAGTDAPRISWLIHWINGARGLGRIAASSILTGFSLIPDFSAHRSTCSSFV